MLRGHDIAANRVSAAPLPVRAAAASRLLSGPSSGSQALVGGGNIERAAERDREPQVFRYNSFEFRYRQDVGRIVLIGQSPETGERVIQVPSEAALRAYVQRIRAQKIENQSSFGKVETVSVNEIAVSAEPSESPSAPAPVVSVELFQASAPSIDISV
jgi:hypothetical protein